MSRNWDLGDRVVFRTSRGMPLQEGVITQVNDGVFTTYTITLDNGSEVKLGDDEILDLWRWSS